MKERKGIAFAGNVLVDVVKNIECYPEMGMLANITSVSQAVGGCVPNTAIDLAVIDPSIPLSAIGKVGKDDYGDYVVKKMGEYGIDTSAVVRCDEPTSFSDVMNLITTGERTFFHCKGANAKFSPEDVDLDSLSCQLLHTGYILLLDQFDAEDEEYGTKMARFLHDAQAKGIKTSVDVASSSTSDYAKVIAPALRYCDYIIFNEIECCGIWGIAPYAAGSPIPDVDAIRLAMEKTLAAGVKEKVIVHCKKAGFCLDKSGKFTCLTSLDIPRSEIKGSVGAGDAFCAGSLYAIYNGFEDEKILEFAISAASANLFSENSIDGMLPKEKLDELNSRYEREVM